MVAVVLAAAVDGDIDVIVVEVMSVKGHVTKMSGNEWVTVLVVLVTTNDLAKVIEEITAK